MVENLIYIVYCTLNKVNGKIYIGVHKMEKGEKCYYLGCGVYANKPSSYNHPKTAFLYAVKKYGPKNFRRIVIKEFDNKDDAFALEAELVNKEFLSRNDVYNMTLGGENGIQGYNSKPCYLYDLNGNFIKEYQSQQEASVAIHRGFTPLKYAIKHKTLCGGYYWTDKKFDALDLNVYTPKSTKIFVYLYNSDGSYECCYESLTDAAKAHNTGTSNISRGCKLGFLVDDKYFSYEYSPLFSNAKTMYLKNRKVYKYSLEGEFLSEYNSIAEAQRENNIKSGLSSAIKLKRTCGNYQWSLEKLDKLPSVVVKCSPRKVGLYDLNGKLIKIYNTVTECTKLFSGCRHVLHGTRHTSGGYIFKYID